MAANDGQILLTFSRCTIVQLKCNKTFDAGIKMTRAVPKKQIINLLALEM